MITTTRNKYLPKPATFADSACKCHPQQIPISFKFIGFVAV